MKNNPVFQVLVTDSSAILAAGNQVTDLAVGQLGAFDAETGLSANIAATMPSRFYFAVGLPNQAGTLGDIRKSAGELIDKNLLNTVHSAEYLAPVSKGITFDLTGFVPVVGDEYHMRFVFQSGQTMNINGYSNPVKSFVVVAATATLGDLLDLIVAEVNKDDEALITASKVGTTVVFAIGSEDKEYVINGVNRRYDALREFNVNFAAGGDFEGVTYTVTETAPVYEQGSGYDIQQLEYVAGGWIGNPGVYRDWEKTGILGSQIQIMAVASTQYWQLRFNYGLKYTSGGSLDYLSENETVIAVPMTNTALIAALVTMVNTYLPSTIGTVAVPTTSTTTTTTTTI